jgi:hypothetical protein
MNCLRKNWQWKKNEWTKIEQDLLDNFGEQINTALTKIDEWLNKCKDYENQTQDDLFGNYKVVEDCLLGFLKNNNTEMKKQPDKIRMVMSQRMRPIKELWQKERLNYVELDWLLRIKMDKASYKPGMEAMAEKQRIVHEGLAEEKRIGLRKKVHEDKAGEMFIKTSIERSPATPASIGRIRKSMLTSDEEADESQDTDIMTGEIEIAGGSSMDSADLWSGADRAMEIIKAGLSSLESMDGTDIRKDNIGVDGEEEWSSGCEELEAEWVYFGEKVLTASEIPTGTMFAWVPCKKSTIEKVNPLKL